MLKLIISFEDRHRTDTWPFPTNVLDRGHGYSNSYNSAKGVVFTHVHGISLGDTVAPTNSHYGPWVENTPDQHTPD